MIKLIDLLNLAGLTLGKWKIHCASRRSQTPPLEAFFDGRFKEWQEWQSQKNFECDHIVSLIDLDRGKWLFAGVYRVDGVRPRKSGAGYQYKTVEVARLGHLTGKAIVSFNKDFRASYLLGKNFGDSLVVSELRERRMTIGEFPGYKSVLLSFSMLRTVIREGNPSWKAALANVAGVYVLADAETGKLYVGSAYGGDGIWQRWAAYVKNGHGGNKEVAEIIKQRGQDYAANFQFSVLEVCDLNSSNDFVISRETHWKNVLLTREFGLNRN